MQLRLKTRVSNFVCRRQHDFLGISPLPANVCLQRFEQVEEEQACRHCHRWVGIVQGEILTTALGSDGTTSTNTTRRLEGS